MRYLIYSRAPEESHSQMGKYTLDHPGDSYKTDMAGRTSQPELDAMASRSTRVFSLSLRTGLTPAVRKGKKKVQIYKEKFKNHRILLGIPL